jgi:hypothetical protein
MRPLLSLTATWLAVFLAACTHGPDTGGSAAESQACEGERVVGAACEPLYIARHAMIMARLEEREQGGGPDIRLIQARSLVSASEELYLGGLSGEASRLLEEADSLLR